MNKKEKKQKGIDDGMKYAKATLAIEGEDGGGMTKRS